MIPTKQSTKERILDAACRLFAERGYHDTTTQMVCEAAGANIAAVHYHYQSKENLYRLVWRRLDDDVRQRYASRLGPATDAEEQLREFIQIRVQGVLSDGPEGRFPRLLHWEMSNPTTLHEEIHEKHVRDKREWFIDLIRKLVGPGPDSDTIHLWAFCINSPLIHLIEMRTKPHRRPPPPGAPPHRRPGDPPEALVETMTTFALAGLQALAAKSARTE